VCTLVLVQQVVVVVVHNQAGGGGGGKIMMYWDCIHRILDAFFFLFCNKNVSIEKKTTTTTFIICIQRLHLALVYCR